MLSIAALACVLIAVMFASGCMSIGGVTITKDTKASSNNIIEDNTFGATTMANSVAPFLMFQGKKAQEAIDFYIEAIPNSRIDEVQLWGDSNPQFSDGIMFATVTIGGQKVMVSDSPIEHAFDFTPSFSFLLECESVEELESLASVLEAEGNVLMPVGSYGFSEKFAFIEDRFGVSWQLVYW